MKVHIVTAELASAKILPRMAQMLNRGLGWTLSGEPDLAADINYAFPYLMMRRPPHNELRMAGLFTHREDVIPQKVSIWEAQARRTVVRICWASQYEEDLRQYGYTVRITPPLDRAFFTPALTAPSHSRPLVGVSGFVYGGGRKGDALVDYIRRLPDLPFDFDAIGRGWSVPTRRLPYTKLPEWYSSIDIYFCPSLIEGIPYGPLEALACGTPVVIPRGVGIMDDLPNIPGIVHYDCGDAEDALRALTELSVTFGAVNPADLRAVTEPFTIEGWVEGHATAFAELEPKPEPMPTMSPESVTREAQARLSKRGIYVVAYGDNARTCAQRLIVSIKRFMPTVPVAVASETPLLEADVCVLHPDVDLGGRTVKVKMFDLAPQEWEEILYLDADTELTADVSFLFDALSDGWEVVLTKDQDDYDLIYSLWRRDAQEMALGKQALGSSRALQLAGGITAFRRTPATQLFFNTWYEEWFRLARRDQGALIRSMYKHPVKLLVLGNEWNSFTGMFAGTSAGVTHHRGGPARRFRHWRGGRLDDPAFRAAIVNEEEHEANYKSRHRSYWEARPVVKPGRRR